MKPADLPAAERLEHGTRARYVAGCRCQPCTAANVAAYHERQARARAAAEDLPAPPPATVPQEWTAPDGTKRTRLYKRACPGIEGKQCPSRSHLRKDSGNVCSHCRDRLVWNGLVSARPARRHLQGLAAKGIGKRAVADACDVAASILTDILAGRKKRIRKQTASRILAVDSGARADGALVPAGRTWQLIGWLLDEGFTKGQIATRLGRKMANLQLGREFVLARTELEVERFYRSVAEVPPDPVVGRGGG